MKRLLVLLMVLGTAYSFCAYNVTDLSVDVTVNELRGTEYFSVLNKTIDFNGNINLFNHAKIFFHKYYVSSPCSADCIQFYPRDVRVGFVILDYSTPSGVNNYSFVEVDYSGAAIAYKMGVGEGEKTKTYSVEGRKVQILVNDIRLNGNCFSTAYNFYCDDATPVGECSTTKPYKCTIHGLEFDQNECGCPIYGCLGSICSDGTFPSECSHEKPLYCDNGKLVDNPIICDCPEYSTKDPSGRTCFYAKCSDGTEFGECSEEKPYYCEGDRIEADLIERSSVCGCPEGFMAMNDTCLIIPETGPGPEIPEDGFENETVPEEQPEEETEPEEEPKETQEEDFTTYYLAGLILIVIIGAYFFLAARRS